jgi:para-nitrobenzyl esterase
MGATTTSEYPIDFQNWLGHDFKEFQEHYPVAKYRSAHEALLAAAADLGLNCPVENLSEQLAVASDAPVYRYIFSHAFSDPRWQSKGAFHGAEISLLFPGSPFDLKLSKSEVTLSSRIQEYWARLARSGDPNGGSDPPWPRYSPNSEWVMEFGSASAARIQKPLPECRFWAEFYATE